MSKKLFLSGLISFVVVFSLASFVTAQNTSEQVWGLEATVPNIVTTLGVANVGIHTSNPDRPLTIQGSGGLVSFRDSSGATRWHISNSDGDWILAQTGVASRLQINNETGAVGLSKTPDSLVKLDVAGAIRVGTGVNEAVVNLPGTIYFNGTNLRCHDGGQWKNCTGGGTGSGGVGFIAPATTNLIPKWDASGATLTNSSISDNGSQVAITKPLQITGNLTVNGSISASGGASVNCPAGQVLTGQRVQGGIITTAGSCSSIVSSTPGFSYWDKDPVLPKVYTTAGIEAVSIGTTAVTRPTITLTVKARPGAAGWIQLQDNTGRDKWHFSEFGGGFSFSETGVGTRFFIQNGTGNLGVGTDTGTPGAKLEVSSPNKNTLRLRRSNPGSVDLYAATGNGTGESLCGTTSGGACLAAFNSARSPIACDATGAIRAVCASVGD